MREIGSFGLTAFSAVALLVLGSGCTDEQVSRQPKSGPGPTSADVDSEYSIKVIVEGKESTLVRFGPLGVLPDGLRSDYWAKAENEPDGGNEDELKPPLTEKVIVDGLDFDDTNEEDELQGYGAGWTLTEIAARTCVGDGNGERNAQGRPDVVVKSVPWSSDLSYYANHIVSAPRSCDGILAAQEVLLCTADRLAEIADGAGTVHWKAQYIDPNDEPVDVQLTIPPQATEDRFIARDMALNVLAGMGQTFLKSEGGGNFPNDAGTCTELYLDFADDPDWDAAAIPSGSVGSLELFNTQFRADGSSTDGEAHHEVFEDDEDTPRSLEETQKVVYARVKLQANVLAGAARLTRKLLEDSVRDDLAGAERARAGAGDAAEGARRMWGAFDPEQPEQTAYYNSLRHAFKVIFGVTV